MANQVTVEVVRLSRLEREILDFLKARVVEPSIPSGYQHILYCAVQRLREIEEGIAACGEAE